MGFIWCSPSFEITKSYYMFLVFGIILKKWLFLYFKKKYYSWMYLERILKKNHEAYPHASTNKWQLGQTRGPVITGLRSISVTCAKLVLCLWNKNKILLFYGKFLYFQNWRNQGRKFRAPLKLTVVCKNLSFSCVQISTWVSPVICQLQSLWNFVPQESIAELIT